MNCLQRIFLIDHTYSLRHRQCVNGIRIALVTIAACGLSLTIGAIVSHFPPAVGYISGACTLASLCGLAISCCKYPSLHTSSSTRQSVDMERSDLNSRSKKAVSGIDALPKEIKLEILEHLTPQELAAMGLTSKSWLKTSANNTLWKEHCQRFFIPDPEEEMIEGSYKREFGKSQSLANAIRKYTPKPTVLSFENDIFSFLVEKDRVFLGMRKAVQVWDRHFTQLNHTIEHPIDYPNKLKMIDGALFCIAKDPRTYDFARLDLETHNSIDKKHVGIRLKEWEERLPFVRGVKGVVEFAKGRAFASYKNGDIRLWNIRKDFTHYEDSSERVMQFLCGIEMYTDQLEYDNYYEKHLQDIELEYAQFKIKSADYEYYKDNILSLMKKKEQSLKECKILCGHIDRITHLKTVGKYLYSSSEDGMIKVWDIDKEHCIQTITTGLPRGVDFFLVHGKYIFGRGRNKKDNRTVAKLWDMDTGLCLQTIELTSPLKTCYLQGNLLFFSYETTIHIYDLKTGKEIRAFNCETPEKKRFVDLKIIDNRLIGILINSKKMVAMEFNNRE